MKDNLKKLLSGIGLCIPLVFNTGNYNISAQETDKSKQNSTVEEIFGVPESVKDFKDGLADKPLGDKPVLVRLSREVDTYVVTSKNGYHLNILAKAYGIKPIDINRDYLDYDIGFSSNDNYILREISKKFDKDKNKVITIRELSGF